MILIADVEIDKISAPAPYSHNEIFVVFGVLFGIEQGLAVDGVELQLMPTKIDKRSNKCRHLPNAVLVAKNIFVHFHRQRATVHHVCQVMLGEGLDTRQGATQLCDGRRRKARAERCAGISSVGGGAYPSMPVGTYFIMSNNLTTKIIIK